MIQMLRKTIGRTGQFLVGTMAGRAEHRPYTPLVWALVAGSIWLVANSSPTRADIATLFAGVYLLVVVTAVCAIDARFGIIPNNLVAAIAAGGVIQTVVLVGPSEIIQRGGEAVVFFAAAVLFRAGYRRLRGQEGLGFGDVKFTTAGVLWIGLSGVAGLLLIAVVSAVVSLVILRTQGYRLGGKHAIPFGPHLAAALWLVWSVGLVQI